MRKIDRFLPAIAMAISFISALWLYDDTYQNGTYHHTRILFTILISSILAAYGFTSWQERPLKRAGSIFAVTILFAVADVIAMVIIGILRPDVSIH